MTQVDYGPMKPELVEVLEGMRRTMSSEKRLLVAKFLARTVSADGDPSEQMVAATIDVIVTDHFKRKYG